MHFYLHRTDPTVYRNRDSAVAIAVAVAYSFSVNRRWRSPAVSSKAAGPSPRLEHVDADLARGQDRLHEIRATVGGLAAAHQVLRHTDGLPAAKRQQLESLCEHEIVRLARLVGSETGACPTEVDLDETIGPIVETLRVRGHRVTWHGASTPVWGRADDVAEIVHILLENAARHAAGEMIEVTTVPHGAFLDVHVRDHGPGVPSELVPRLFDRGVRRPGSPGEGIGLSIARRRATEMGGRLRLAPSRPGQTGADFVLTLPTSARNRSCLVASR